MRCLAKTASGCEAFKVSAETPVTTPPATGAVV